MLYLRSLTLNDLGDRKNPNRVLRCAFSVDKNKYAVTRTTSIFENTEATKAAFVALCEDFGIEEEDKTYAVNCDEEFSGEFVELSEKDGVPMHKVKIGGTSAKPEWAEDANGDPIVASSVNTVICSTFGQTKESVLRSYLRSWRKQGAIVERTSDDSLAEED